MAAIYCCGNERRRALVRQSTTLNGIDYVVVQVGDGPGVTAGQSKLTVQFIKNLPTMPAPTWTASIVGGLRGASVAVFPPITVGTSTLEIRTALPPDNGKYTLTLQPSSGSFDTYLLAVDFYFQSTSVTSTDCQSQPTPPQSQLLAPQIDYLAKDFGSFQRLMLDRLSALSPDWKERNPADLGTVMVDLLAYAADQLSYYQDAVATEAYLGTARKRISVGRHARLFGYNMHQGCNARALLCVEVGGTAVVSLYAGQTWFLSRCQDQPVVLGQSAGTTVPVQLLDSLRTKYGAAVFELMHNAELHPDKNTSTFYTWGDESCCLPAGSTSATLLKTGSVLPVKGDILIFVENRNPVTGLTDNIDPKRRWAVRLTNVTLGTDPLTWPERTTPQDYLKIEWDPADALPFSLVLSARIGTNYYPDMSVALGNVVLVDHGQTIPSEPLVPAAPVPGEPYRPILQRVGLTFQTAAPATSLPASAVTSQDPSTAQPALTCKSADGKIWKPTNELLHSRSDDRQFVAEMDDETRASLRFGDGTLGQSPVGGLAATYRVGNGAVGNVAAEAIYHIIGPSPTSAFRRVYNPLPASGGHDPELTSEVRLNVPQSFRRQERGATEEDYAELALRFGDVVQAAGAWRWTGAYRTMYLTILRKNDLAVDETFKQNLRAYLERFRLLGTEIVIVPALFVPLDISLTVHLAAGALRSAVRDALMQSFSDMDLPNGKQGFFHPDHFGFGKAVYLGQVLAAINQVPGVLWIDTDPAIATNRFKRLGSSQNELTNGKIVIGRTELARLGGAAEGSSVGNLEFHLEGGL